MSTNSLSGDTAQAELREIFPAPILMYEWPNSEELNCALRQTIQEHRSEGDTVYGHGWRSAQNLETWDAPCIGQLLERIQAMVQETVLRTVKDPDHRHFNGWSVEAAWANVHRRGGANKPHNHVRNNTTWAGIYYVHVGGPDGSPTGGCTKFQDRSGIPKEILRDPDLGAYDFTVVPKPGLMVIFPGSISHYVEPNQGDDERITIAFNLEHPGFTRSPYGPPVSVSFWWRNFRGIMLVGRALSHRIHLLGDRILRRT